MGSENHDFLPDDPQPGPSWQRAGWPLAGGGAEDDLTQALDPLALKAAIKASAEKAGTPIGEASIEMAAADSIRAMMLIRTYRVRGHLAADLDPLGLSQHGLQAAQGLFQLGRRLDQQRPERPAGLLSFNPHSTARRIHSSAQSRCASRANPFR